MYNDSSAEPWWTASPPAAIVTPGRLPHAVLRHRSSWRAARQLALQEPCARVLLLAGDAGVGTRLLETFRAACCAAMRPKDRIGTTGGLVSTTSACPAASLSAPGPTCSGCCRTVQDVELRSRPMPGLPARCVLTAAVGLLDSVARWWSTTRNGSMQHRRAAVQLARSGRLRLVAAYRPGQLWLGGARVAALAEQRAPAS
jgi:hypothetical protein